MGQRQDHAQEQQKTQQRLLELEAALLFLLHRKIRSQQFPGDLGSARATLVQSLAGVYLTGRLAAKAAGIYRLDAELTAIDPELAGLAPQDALPDRFGVGLGTWALLDGRRAMRAAGGYGDWWQTLARQEIAAGSEDPYKSAFARAEARLQTGAITESSEAFSRARQETIVRLGRRLRDADLVRVWNAVLDKRTCSHCSKMDGKWVPIGDTFPGGRPGGVHPRCRCYEELVPRSWVDGLDIAA